MSMWWPRGHTFCGSGGWQVEKKGEKEEMSAVLFQNNLIITNGHKYTFGDFPGGPVPKTGLRFPSKGPRFDTWTGN